MTGTVQYQKHGKIVLLRIDNPPVNALGRGVREGILEGIRRAERDGEVEGIVLVGEGRTFPAGADIREFGKPPQSPSLHEVLAAMERGDAPIVAAIHGTALGGGLETALCCDWRVATPDARVGLPEVQLGLLPGAGGTQRLPRLVGARAALEIMTRGEHVPARRALELGLVDAVVEGDLVEEAVAFLGAKLEAGGGRRRIRDMDERVAADRERPELFEHARAEMGRRRRGQEAPQRIVDCVEKAVRTDDFDEGLAFERARFGECMESPQRAAMIHVFFAERTAQRIPDVPRDTPRETVARAAVIGGGTMGRGIAMVFADAGIAVTLVEQEQPRLDDAMAAVRATYASSVKKGRLVEEAMQTRLALIRGTIDSADLAGADLVVEAVYEDLELKKKVFAELDSVTPPEALLASNTSTLDLDDIASATSRPSSVVGMHFFSPAQVMKLLEVVRGRQTGKHALATAMDLGKRLGKVAVCAGNCDGFIGNRMLAGYGREAAFLLEEGALPHEVDQALVEFGMPMGPFAMGDLAGLDVGWRIRQRRGRPEGLRYSDIADRLCEQGRFGQKTGAGWYRYEEGSRTPVPDPEVEALIVETSRRHGIARRAISSEEIVERCIYPLVNEGARILEEGIAIRPGDIDVVWVYGYGFPVWRGGPMFWADRIGLARIHERIVEMHGEHGPYWEPAPLLVRLAESGRGFGDLGAEE